MKLYEYLLKTYGKTNPIFIKDIKIENMTEIAVRTGISRLLKAGKIKREATGIYYIPENIEILGLEKALSISDICQKKYIENEEGKIGYYTGLYLLNGLGFITQVPNTLEIVTNSEKKNSRTVNIKGTKRILKKPYTKITTENEKYLQFLELLRILPNEDFNKDKNNNYKNIGWYIKKREIDLEETKKYIYYYPKKVAKRFMEVENDFTQR
mgnify:CR=1 FL=1